jgi:glycosyltransferase involved in cell wall biosynthesis
LDVAAYDLASTDSGDGVVRLAWIGAHTTLKYLRGIRPALEEVGRRFGNVALRTICDGFLDLHSMKVENRHWSRQSEAMDLATSDIGLAPLPDNSFTRGKCGFKILQYQAAGLPVVASPVGVNKDYVVDGVTGFLAAEPSQWVNALDLLIRDANLRKTLGQAGRREVTKLDMRIIGANLCKLVMECLGQSDA